MKQREEYLDQKLKHMTVDNAVHVVHSDDRSRTVSYIIMRPCRGLPVLASVARRNPKDNFNRRLGRLISKGRLLDRRNCCRLVIDSVPQNADEWRVLDRKVLGLFQ